MDGRRGFLGLIIQTGPVNNYRLYYIIYPGYGEKRYPVIPPPFFGGI